MEELEAVLFQGRHSGSVLIFDLARILCLMPFLTQPSVWTVSVWSIYLISTFIYQAYRFSSLKVSLWRKPRVNASLAGDASILRGDYSPWGCYDVTGLSIFGDDMGHWWWWCVSTWGFPSAWGRRKSEEREREKKAYLKASEVLGLVCFVDMLVFLIWNHKLVHTAITQTQGLRLISNDLIYLLLGSLYSPQCYDVRATSSYTLTAG